MKYLNQEFFLSLLVKNKDLIKSITGWLLRILGAACGFLTFRQLFIAIGPEGVAGISILQSIGGWFAILEIGTGYVAQNYIVKSGTLDINPSYGVKQILLRPLYLSSVFLIPLCLYNNDFFNFIADGEAAGSLKGVPELVFFTALYYLLTNFSSAIIKILYAEGKVFWANLIPVLGSIMNLVLVVSLNYLGVRSFVVYVACIVLPSNLPLLCIAIFKIFYARKNRKEKSIELPKISDHYSYSIFNFAAILVLRADVFILSRVLNPNQLVAYIAVQKIYTLVSLGPQTMLASIHPKFSSLYLLRDYKKLKEKIIQFGLFPGLIIIFACFFFAIFDKQICPLITAKSMQSFGSLILIWAAIYYLLRVWTDSWATSLLAANKTKFLLLPTIIQGLVSVPLLYYLGERFGAAGGFIALLLSFLLTTVWWAPVLVLNKLFS